MVHSSERKLQGLFWNILLVSASCHLILAIWNISFFIIFFKRPRSKQGEWQFFFNLVADNPCWTSSTAGIWRRSCDWPAVKRHYAYGNGTWVDFWHDFSALSRSRCSLLVCQFISVAGSAWFVIFGWPFPILSLRVSPSWKSATANGWTVWSTHLTH